MATPPALIPALADLFAGRSDVFAVGTVNPDTNKARYARVDDPVTPELWRQHLEGRRLVGLYPIVENRVKWFALDIDAPDTDPPDDAAADWRPPTPEEQWAAVWQDALVQYRALSNAGLHVYLERSRSGTGIHIWGFLDDWLDAAIVRRAIKPLLTEPDTFDRMYPVQDALTEQKPLGNLIALPYHGAFGTQPAQSQSTFLTPEGRPIGAETLLMGVRKNALAVLQHLAAKAPKERSAPRPTTSAPTTGGRDPQISMGRHEGRPAKLLSTGLLTLVSPYGCEFMRKTYRNRARVKEPQWYAAIGQLTAFEHGRDAAHIFSQGHPGYDPQETDRKFDHALEHPPVGCAYIHEHFPKAACQSCPMKAPYHQAQRSLSDLTTEETGTLLRGGFGTYLPKIWARDEGREVPGIPFGLGELDRYTRWRRGELVVWGAQVSMGKTASMVHQAIAIAASGHRARVFSGEMGQEGLYERFLAHLAEVDSKKLMGESHERLTTAERRRVEDAARALDQLPLEFNFTATTPQAILRATEHSIVTQRLPFEEHYVALFDYLQFAAKVKGDLDPRARVSRTVKELKLMAKLLEQSVGTYSQITRDAEGGDAPKVTWFKESGDIEAEMDVGLIWTGERMEGRTVPRRATIVKQRRGSANVGVDFLLDQATSHYTCPGARATGPAQPPLFGDPAAGFGEDGP